MIASFLDSWELFQHAYLAGWLIGLLLSLIGVVVVARDQIFIGVAVSQASTLGIAVGLMLGGWVGSRAMSWVHSDSFLSGMAVLFAVLAALFTAGGSTRERESHEAITGWVFLLSASFSILLVAHSPFGLDEIQRLMSSSIIGATAGDAWTFAVFVALTLAVIGLAHRRILLCAMDPAMAAAVGMRVPLWEGGMAIWLGLAVGLSMRVAGVLFTFGCLVLPALVAKNICREVRSVFWVAPLIAVTAGLISFVLAHHYDYPSAQMTVALLSGLLLASWAVRGFYH